MRLSLFIFLLCAAAQAQQGLRTFLALTPAQITQVQQSNAILDQFVSAKQQRSGQIYQDLNQEYTKPAPDPFVLGQRYQELAAISRDIAAQQAAVQVKISALLATVQKTQVQQIAVSAVQIALVTDASCVDLAYIIPTLADRLGNFDLLTTVRITVPSAAFLRTNSSSYNGCSSVFPISIRTFLTLTDAQVSALQNILLSYKSLNARKQSRIFDVQIEIRDETAKLAPDPIALGIRYAELSEIAQELTQADIQSHAAAAAILSQTQAIALQQLTNSALLTPYIAPAESCHFIATPPGTAGQDYSGGSCSNYF